MKTATGELNLTLIAVITIGVLLTAFAVMILPNMKDDINQNISDQTNVEISFNFDDVKFG